MNLGLYYVIKKKVGFLGGGGNGQGGWRDNTLLSSYQKDNERDLIRDPEKHSGPRSEPTVLEPAQRGPKLKK